LIDNNYAKLKICSEFTFFDTRKIHVFVLLKSFIRNPCFNIRDINGNYRLFMINEFSPHVIIFNDMSYFNIPESCNATIIVYQFGYAYSINNFSNEKKIKCDYFLAINEKQKDIFKRKIIGNIVVSGSVKSNCNVLNEKTRSYDLLFVSQYREYVNESITDLYLQVVLMVKEYAKNYTKKLGIAYISKRTDKLINVSEKNEIEYFRSKIGVVDTVEKDSYQKAAETEVIICMNSGLGIELLSHGKKVVFIDIISMLYPDRKLPFFDEDTGFFWITYLDINKISRIIDTVYSMSYNEWNDYLNTHHKNLLTGDKNNTELNDIINNSI